MTPNYLKIIGRLTDNRTLKIRHSYMVHRQELRLKIFDSPLLAECLDRAGNVLNSVPILARPYNLPKDAARDLAIRALIPIPDNAGAVRFMLSGESILDITIADEPPQVSVDWQDIIREPKGKRKIQWTPLPGRPESYRTYLEYSIDDGRTWRRLPHIAPNRERTVDLDRLPGGKNCRFALIATDGVRVTRIESPSFSNDIKPCIPMIFKPADGATFAEGERVELVGQGFYREEHEPELTEIRWESSKDGSLGKGSFAETEKLSKGIHKIVMTVGKGRRAASRGISIKVG